MGDFLKRKSSIYYAFNFTYFDIFHNEDLLLLYFFVKI